jgi:hypothetical protein
MVIWIFHIQSTPFTSPLGALIIFLEFFATFDWQKYAIGVYGPVLRSAVPVSPVAGSPLPFAIVPPSSNAASGTASATASQGGLSGGVGGNQFEANGERLQQYGLDMILHKYTGMHSKFESAGPSSPGVPVAGQPYAGCGLGGGGGGPAAQATSSVFHVIDPVVAHENLARQEENRDSADVAEVTNAFKKGSELFPSLRVWFPNLGAATPASTTTGFSPNSSGPLSMAAPLLNDLIQLNNGIGESSSASAMSGESESSELSARTDIGSSPPAQHRSLLEVASTAAAATVTVSVPASLEEMDTDAFMDLFFPVTVRLLLVRKQSYAHPLQVQEVHANKPYVTEEMAAAASAYLMSWPDDSSNLRDIMFGITRAQVILAKASPEMIVYLIFQILQKRGCLAVGEVGKHIQDILGEKGE